MYGETAGTILVSGSNSQGYLISRKNVTTGVVDNVDTRVFHVTLLSWGTAASVLQLYSGTNVGTFPTLIVGGTGATYIGSGGLNRVEFDTDYGNIGHTFPNGCYYVADTNFVQAAIVCKADKF